MPYEHYGKWRARWNDEKAKSRSKNFDDFRSAKYHEEKMKAEVAEIRRGLRTAAPPPRTFNALVEYWRGVYAPRKRSWKNDESILRTHLLPRFRDFDLRAITVEAVDRMVAQLAHLNEKTVANVLTLLISLLNRARDLGWLDRTPRIRKPRVRMHRRDFHFLRSEEEIRRMLAAALVDGELVQVLYATAIWTGARAGELAGLHWSDVDLEARLITIQRSFDGPTKADDVRYVPILDPLLALLRRWRLKCPGRLVFPNEVGDMHQRSARVFQETLHRVLARAQFEKVERQGKLRACIRFHDLRHTFASHWVMRGGDLFKLQRILGHKSIAMTMRYAHLAPDAFAADYKRFGVDLLTVAAAVVPIQDAKTR